MIIQQQQQMAMNKLINNKSSVGSVAAVAMGVIAK